MLDVVVVDVQIQMSGILKVIRLVYTVIRGLNMTRSGRDSGSPLFTNTA
jgi:hypothetical protein